MIDSKSWVSRNETQLSECRGGYAMIASVSTLVSELPVSIFLISLSAFLDNVLIISFTNLRNSLVSVSLLAFTEA